MDKTPCETRSTHPSAPDQVIVGRIKGSWGLQGDLKIEPLTDSPHRFSPGSLLFLGCQQTRVLASRRHKGGLVVRLDLVKDRTHAETLRDLLLTVPRDYVKSLPEGSYYHFQLLDLSVFDQEGEYLGRIKEILSTGSNDVYVVGVEGRRDLLVPALKDVVREVDLGDERMVVLLPEGLK